MINLLEITMAPLIATAIAWEIRWFFTNVDMHTLKVRWKRVCPGERREMRPSLPRSLLIRIINLPADRVSRNPIKIFATLHPHPFTSITATLADPKLRTICRRYIRNSHRAEALRATFSTTAWSRRRRSLFAERALGFIVGRGPR